MVIVFTNIPVFHYFLSNCFMMHNECSSEHIHPAKERTNVVLHKLQQKLIGILYKLYRKLFIVHIQEQPMWRIFSKNCCSLSGQNVQ